MTKVSLFGFDLTLLDLSGITNYIQKKLASPGFHRITTLNPEILIQAMNNPALKTNIQSSFIIPESMGICWAAQWITGKSVHRVSGIDLVNELLSMNQFSFYFIGGQPGVAQEAKDFVTRTCPGSQVVGTSHGYLTQTDMAKVITQISRLKPDIVLVGMGCPRQENCLNMLKNLPHGIGMGVGGTLDILSNKKQRAPLIIRKWGMEWAYRLIHEPLRIRRFLRWSPQFIWLLIKALLAKTK